MGWLPNEFECMTDDVFQRVCRVADFDFSYEDLRREYEDLRREYEDLRRTWNTDGNTLDVIIGNTVTAKENTAHPTTKPIWIMERLIKMSTNPGDTVLLEGVPDLKLKILGGIPGDVATAASVVNALRRLPSARPGLVTVLDLPSAASDLTDAR